VLYELSYANLSLYSAVLPSYDTKKEKQVLNGDDEENVEAFIQAYNY
jgi:hypothetical protein